MSCLLCQCLSGRWLNELDSAFSVYAKYGKPDRWVVLAKDGDLFRQTNGEPIKYSLQEALELSLKYGWKARHSKTGGPVLALSWIKERPTDGVHPDPDPEAKSETNGICRGFNDDDALPAFAVED